MKNPWILPAVTLLIGVAGGYISGKNTGSADSKAAAAGAEGTTKTRSSLRSQNRPEGEGATKRGGRGLSPEQVGRLAGSSNRVQAMIDYYAGLSPAELEDEAGKLEQLPMSERILASFLLFGRWAEVDATAAMEYSNTMGFTGGFVRPTILQSWASVDPANAAKYYGENSRQFAMMGMMGGGRGPMGGQGGASIIASEWAKQDPAGALSWANSLTTEKSDAVSAVVGEVARSDPKKATEMLASMGSAEDLGRAYRAVASQYGAANFSEARSWVSTLPEGERDSALASAIEGLAKADPVSAAREADQMTDGDAKNGLLPDIIGSLARVDPVAAAGLAKKQGDERTQREAMDELMPAWVAKDPAAALQFATTSLEPGDVQDRALQSIVWSNSAAPPAESVKIAERISDEGDRNRTVAIAAMRWMREDADAAKAYVEQSTTLTDETKTNILEGRSPWGRGRGRGGN